MEPENQVIFSMRNIASLDIWSKIIEPSQPATLPTPIQTCTNLNN